MVVLVDWNEKIVFDKEVVVNSVNHSFFKEFDEVFDFKWVVLPEEGERVKRVKFEIKPQNKAFDYSKNLILKNKSNNIFKLKVDTSKLPDYWRGDLLIKADNMVKRVELVFEKNMSTFRI